MKAAPTGIHTHEHRARQMILAQAIETCDTQGKLLSAVEQEELDRLTLQTAKSGAPGAPVNVESFLRERAQHVLRVIEVRSPALASLQEPRPWTPWLAAAALVGAVALGAATDRLANPHRVDLLSLPLLAILGWNVLMYCTLLLGYVMQRTRSKRATPASFARWAAALRGWHRRSGQLQAQVTALFLRQWYGATAALQVQRWRKVLHLAAAGWALGVALSLFTRGLVVEYRVGWESTFLSAEQVHAILSVLLMPAMALFPFEPFSVQDIAALKFSNSSGALAGARWVYLYATLLAVVVILPRLMLALFAWLFEQMLSRRVWISLADGYHQRLLHMLNPASVQLGLMSLVEEDKHTLLRVLRRRAHALHESAGVPVPEQGEIATLLHTSSGEELCIANIAAMPLRPAGNDVANAPARWADRAASALGWLMRTSSAISTTTVDRAWRTGSHASDVVLLVVRSAGDSEMASRLLRTLNQPALVLVNSREHSEAERETDAAQCRVKLKLLGLPTEVLGFDCFARCWVQDPVLLGAIERCMPAHQKEGFTRLAAAWLTRNQERFKLSMQVIAQQLFDAAGEIEKVSGGAPSVMRRINASDRQADAQARTDAMAAVVERLHRSARATHAKLLRLHGFDDAAGQRLDDSLEEKFDIQAPVNAGEAAMAGAATGAGTGAAVDLMTGGLTLGAATALGALIGGGAALAGAAWSNRATPGGAAIVQLSDDMLQALLAATLLRYLAVAHFEDEAPGQETVSDMAKLWKSKVADAVTQRKEILTGIWTSVRKREAKREDQAQAVQALGQALQASASEVLRDLYPAAPAF